MTSYKAAYRVLSEAIRNPADPEKLKAAKAHPKLKNTLRGFTQTDFEVLQKVFVTRKKKPGSRILDDLKYLRVSAALPGDPFFKKRRGGQPRKRV